MDTEELDLELQQAVVDSLLELDPRHSLPYSELCKIAREVIAEDKVTDGEWGYQRIQESKKEFRRKRNIAKVRGYAPFTCLSQRVYVKLRETFGEEMLGILKTYLKDPEDIYTKWCYRFAATIDAIGRKECLSHRENIYAFVTTHPSWEQQKERIMEDFRLWIGHPDAVQQASDASSSAQGNGHADAAATPAAPEAHAADELPRPTSAKPSEEAHG